MDPDPRGFPQGDLRVSDAERDRALDELSQAFQVGRITAEEFDQRSEQVLAARTGRELTTPLADLPVDYAPAGTAPAGTALEPADRAPARRFAVGATVGATVFALVAVANALSQGPSLQQRELAQQIFAMHGISIPLPPAQGFNWAGTVIPAIVALAFVMMIIVSRARARRA